jgi:hypothetical protein
MKTGTVKTLSLGLTLACAAPAQAQVTGEVIAAQLAYSTNTAVMSATNGGQYSEVPCGTDLSHGGSPRYFLDAVPSGQFLPDGYEGSFIIAADEGCTQPLAITNSVDMRFSNLPRWSPDDTRIAVYGEHWDLVGGVLRERGVFLMDVIYDSSGRPVGTANMRLIIPLPGEMLVSWSGDGEWLVYHDLVPDGAGGSQQDLFLFDLLTETSSNLTNSPGVSETHPDFSPVDYRIAYTQLVQIRGSYRFDIFTIDVLTGAVSQITSKKTIGSPANRFPSFSPDGQYLAFSSGSITGPVMPSDIYKIRSNGSGKAVNLTGKRDGDFRWHVWRE